MTTPADTITYSPPATALAGMSISHSCGARGAGRAIECYRTSRSLSISCDARGGLAAASGEYYACLPMVRLWKPIKCQKEVPCLRCAFVILRFAFITPVVPYRPVHHLTCFVIFSTDSPPS